MNALIQELARESHIDVYGLGKDRAKWEACLGKYAELIVRECNKAVLEVPVYYKNEALQIEECTIIDCGRAVLEHFGADDERTD